MPDLSDFFPAETDSDVYARMVADLPTLPLGQVWNTREGSVVHGFLASFITERRRFIGYAREALRQTFMLYATGDFLDTRAAEVGVSRTGARPATVVLSLTGADGGVVPAGSIFSSTGDAVTGTTGINFSTVQPITLTGGVGTVTAVSLQSGADTNVGAGTVTAIVSSPDIVDTVTNAVAAYGGSDKEDDDSLRQRALQAAAAFPQTGNANLYRTQALIQPDVGVVQVIDQWNGVGTGMVVIGGTNTAFAQPATVDALQAEFDPSIMSLAHGESPETWVLTNASQDLATPLGGQASIVLAPTTSADATAVYTFPAALDLSRFSGSTDEMWLYVKRITPGGQSFTLTITLTDNVGAHKDYVFTNTTIDALTSVASRAFWTFQLGNLSTTINLRQVVSITLKLAQAATPSSLELDGIKLRMASGGVLTGMVPLGIQVVVRSARQIQLNVSASVVLRPGVSITDVRTLVAAALTTFFATIPPGGVVYLGDVSNVIHDTSGIIDHSNVQIGPSGLEAPSSYSLGSDQRPILGNVTLV